MTNVMFRRSRCRRSRVEKLRNGRDKLRWRERLLQKDAFGYALRSPLIGSRPGHVDYGKFRIDLPEPSRDFPAVHPALQVNVGNERPVVFRPALEQRQRLFTRGQNVGCETAFS